VSLEPSTFQRRALLAGELARACGVMRGHKPSVLDAMGGLGVDGMTLVELGCEVVMVERATVVWAMMASFMKAYQPAGLTLIQADAWSWLAGAHRRFDVVYLDPMFPGRHKGALPGKAMQYLTELTELTELTDADSRPLTGWIDHAKAYAIARVVLKRRLRDSVVGAPDWQIKGRTVRYDVYRGIGGSATTE
jgi:16S rRNA (guanine1516-N2)-methyltransferase